MMTASEIQRALVSGEVSLKEYYRNVLDAASTQNALLNCFITPTTELVWSTVERLQRKLQLGQPLGKLFGLPIAVKDNICLKDYPTTCGSKMLANYFSPYNATTVDRLIAEDAVVIAKSNMDEFAMGSSNENSAFGPVKNPHDLTKVPGGSSGGSAAAVAANLVPMGLGSDTGGSVRQPAAYCGVVGLKPTYGAVSRYGLVAFASSMDQIGPIGVDVDSTALLFEAIRGHDPKDSTSAIPDASDSTITVTEGVKGLKIGLPREYFAVGLDGEIRSAIASVVEYLGRMGAELIDVSLPHSELAIATYYIIADAEASSNLARYDGVKFGHRISTPDLTNMYTETRHSGFGKEVKRRILLGTYVLSSGYYEAYYRKAMQVRRLIIDDFQRAFGEVDILLTPATPTTAFKLGERIDDPLAMYLSDVYTVSANLTGLPALSIPCGKDKSGMPIGLQLISTYFKEELLFRTGRAIERAFRI